MVKTGFLLISYYFALAKLIDLICFLPFKDNAFNHWIKKYGWKDQGEAILIAKQDENIKTKNITEKIAFENLSNIMSKCL